MDDLDIGYAAVGALTSAVFLGAALASSRAGRWVDALGAGPALTLALLLMATFLGLAAVPAGYGGLLVAALAAGAAFAFVNPAANAAVGATFQRGRRGTAMGLKQTGIAAGGILAGLWLPSAAIAFGWRVALAQVAALLAVGAITSSLTLGSPRPRPRASRSRHAVSARRLLPLWIGGFLLSGSQAFLIAYVALFALEAGEFSAAAAGVLFAAVQLAALAGRIAFGAISDSLFGGRRRPVLVATAAAGAASLAALAPLGSAGARPALAVAAVVAGLTAIGWNGVYMAALVDEAPAAAHGAASGTGIGFNLAGVVVFPLLGGLFLDVGAGYAVVWVTAAAIAMLAALAFASFAETTPGHGRPARGVAEVPSVPASGDGNII